MAGTGCATAPRGLEAAVVELVRRGPEHRIHVVLTADRWADLSAGLPESVGTRLELRLRDAERSMVSRRAALAVPRRDPGYGLTPDGRHFRSAAPWPDAAVPIRAAWSGQTAPQMRMLPELLSPADLPDRPGEGFPIGLDESTLEPVRFDPGADQHLVVVGDPGSGRTGVLRLIAQSIVARCMPAEARLMLVDPRRGLTGAADGRHLLIHAGSRAAVADAVATVRQAMTERLPGPEVTAERLRKGRWWRGPDLFVLVDDYDLVAGTDGDPLAELVPLLPYARDIGLHLIVARRTAGAARAMYEPLPRMLTLLNSAFLLLSGSPAEGPIVGDVRPAKQPPGRGTLVTRAGVRVVQTAYPQ
ncbi:DNA translocase ftsK [Actinoplanes sp. SE50]|uniref:type VII secretion protein EccCb n=1 Tax=unclassified Actinoplanes TaxID=2626549 RepID=UPI00023EC33B|nr:MULTISPECIES: type VII secretion protein EccCb [unclassified Actinoplanes]AEV86985.1 DNA translocase ftsK [Actinoplanes sp. SE50/110]ATO85381.1 DNA translocase ftsK [Actinoplanes sp. SE50]SLM02793.1 type VII secretion protein EccCb [Actinoplanes sp. SE50/110]